MSGRSIRTRSSIQQPRKVVYIETQYVETDAWSFKSVVQNLTGKGKDSPAVVGDGFCSPAKTQKKKSEEDEFGGSYSFLRRELSSKEVDGMLKELPTLAELHKLLTFD